MLKIALPCLWAGLLIISSGEALADRTIFKCKGPEGMIYQKTPCAEGQESVSSWMPPEATEAAPKQSLVLEQGRGGHYFLDSEINGNEVTFVVDTGASVVSLPLSVAEAAELSCDRQTVMQTANGATAGCAVVIDKLKLGNFLLRDVDAVVVPNLAQPLLGMNVLKRFNITQDSDRLRISDR